MSQASNEINHATERLKTEVDKAALQANEQYAALKRAANAAEARHAEFRAANGQQGESAAELAISLSETRRRNRVFLQLLRAYCDQQTNMSHQQAAQLSDAAKQAFERVGMAAVFARGDLASDSDSDAASSIAGDSTARSNASSRSAGSLKSATHSTRVSRPHSNSGRATSHVTLPAIGGSSGSRGTSAKTQPGPAIVSRSASRVSVAPGAGGSRPQSSTRSVGGTVRTGPTTGGTSRPLSSSRLAGLTITNSSSTARNP